MPEEDLLVLTNQNRIDGAACILYDIVLEKNSRSITGGFLCNPK